MPILLDYSLSQLETVCEEMGQPKYRAKQLQRWLALGEDFGGMTDMPKQFRESLASLYVAQGVAIEQKIVSKDKTAKYLFRLEDGNIIEGVLMRYKYGNTLCLSTQVGCRMNCAFCASGIGGLVRNLTSGEMLGQVIAVNKDVGGTQDKRQITNLVLMGSGEPLDNYQNVTQFLRAVSSEEWLNISQRNISLSTCGIVDNIYQLANDGFSVTLTISLHASTDSKRKELVRVAGKYPLADFIKASRYYFEKTGRRVVFEYALVGGVNHSPEDARSLSMLLKGFPTHVNLIMLNPVAEKGLKPCTRAQAEAFLKELERLGTSATLRRTMGSDINGACGQLRNLYVGQNDPVSSAKSPKNHNM